jgi:uncharacterized protein YbcI
VPVEVETEIAREIRAVHEENYRVGAGEIHVHVVADFVLVVLDVELTQAEQTLIDAGRPDAVTGVRESFQEAIAATFSAIVERATGRRVISFVSHMSVEPLYELEVFRLAPSD